MDQAKELAADIVLTLGGISGICTVLAHVLPWPAVASFFARIGVATSRFVVVKK